MTNAKYSNPTLQYPSAVRSFSVSFSSLFGYYVQNFSSTALSKHPFLLFNSTKTAVFCDEVLVNPAVL